MKLLGILDPSKKVNRVARRVIAIGVFTGLSALIVSLIPDIPGNFSPYLVPVLTAILAGIDKITRELKKEPVKYEQPEEFPSI